MPRKALSLTTAPDHRGNALALLEFQSPTAALIATPVPPSARYLSAAIAIAVLSCVVAASVIKIDKIVVASGKLVSTVPTILMQPLQTAIVKDIYVHPGQIVHKGDLLAAPDPTFSAADSTADQEQVNSYTAQIARLTAQIKGVPYAPVGGTKADEMQLQAYMQLQSQYRFGVDNYDQQIASLQAKLQQARSDVVQYARRLAIASNVEEMRNKLEQMQVGSKLDSLSAADNRLNIAGNLADANASAQQAIGDIASTKAQRGAFIQQW